VCPGFTLSAATNMNQNKKGSRKYFEYLAYCYCPTTNEFPIFYWIHFSFRWENIFAGLHSKFYFVNVQFLFYLMYNLVLHCTACLVLLVQNYVMTVLFLHFVIIYEKVCFILYWKFTCIICSLRSSSIKLFLIFSMLDVIF